MAHAFLVLIQFSLGFNHPQDPFGTGESQLDQVVGEDRDESREPQGAEKPHKGDNISQSDRALAPEHQSMEKSGAPAEAEHEHWKVAGLDESLPHEVVSEHTGIVCELVPFIPLPNIRLNHFDPGDGLSESGVEHTELLSLSYAHGFEAVVIINNCNRQKNGKDRWNKQKAGIDKPDHEHRNYESQDRVDDQHQSGTEH